MQMMLGLNVTDRFPVVHDAVMVCTYIGGLAHAFATHSLCPVSSSFLQQFASQMLLQSKKSHISCLSLLGEISGHLKQQTNGSDVKTPPIPFQGQVFSVFPEASTNWQQTPARQCPSSMSQALLRPVTFITHPLARGPRVDGRKIGRSSNFWSVFVCAVYNRFTHVKCRARVHMALL